MPATEKDPLLSDEILKRVTKVIMAFVGTYAFYYPFGQKDYDCKSTCTFAETWPVLTKGSEWAKRMKAVNPNLQVTISFGGWNQGPGDKPANLPIGSMGRQCGTQNLTRAERRYMVDFNESEGESAFLVVRSTKGVWFDNPHVFHRSLAKVPISFCFAEGAQVQTELGPTASVKVGGYFASSADYEEWYQRRRASLTLAPSLGAEACGVKNDVVATIKPAAAEVSAVAKEAVAEEAVAEEAAKEVEKPAKTVSNAPDPADTTCYPGLPTPKVAGKSGPASARSGSAPGYVDGVEAAVRRLGESVSYQATPADGKKSPSPGVPTSGGIAPVAPKPLGAVAGAGLAEAEAAKEREHWEGRLKKAKAALDLIAERREKWADLQSRRSRNAGGRAALKAAANCVQGGYTKAEGAFRWLLLVCMPAFGHCASAVPSPTAVASAFSSAAISWLTAGPLQVAATVTSVAVIGTVKWRRKSKARRFGWSSLLGILLCLATVSQAQQTGDLSGWATSADASQRLEYFDAGALPSHNRFRKQDPRFTHTERGFVTWNALRLGITVEAASLRYNTSTESFDGGYRGDEYRTFCVSAYKALGVLATDAPSEMFDSYRLFAAYHTLRLISYNDATHSCALPIHQEMAAGLASAFDASTLIEIVDFGAGMAQESRCIAEILRVKHGRTARLHLFDIPTPRKSLLDFTCRKFDGFQCIVHDVLNSTKIPPLAHAVFATEVLEHMYPPQTMGFQEELARALVPRGLFRGNVGDHGKEFMHVNPNTAKSWIGWLKQHAFRKLRGGLYQRSGTLVV
ncbi:hypothetical protein EMIHUDRAFT_213006 [Emiliania huxleyi CCMP1516]|uniref:Methyltransferase type 11 domain-containing protein n=2 Tax=Emiliania huxleyi TaxID=2903 RepID=A0A0D3INH5_EMIH1|nr:hypothetical protein EMIHUDRAFT_213006 [Emiliania huxleyi CCMP1516]EOD12810.1 hypothetical protein EMIHUDRAFT_213006 [Emiliania huxleyi CCMP1516]|eukprot:XP_005765239.1 hypothetical protein EMIHUDRAFT_213006 [Emiliania huxleyi CCMP1516]